jgi:hypothetical protein
LTKLRSYSNNIAEGETEGGNDGNSLLHEVQKEEGDKESAAGYAQEPQACHPRGVPCVWHESIQNRKALDIYSNLQVFGCCTSAVVPILSV